MWKAGLSSKQDAWTLARDLEERPGSARAWAPRVGKDCLAVKWIRDGLSRSPVSLPEVQQASPRVLTGWSQSEIHRAMYGPASSVFLVLCRVLNPCLSTAGPEPSWPGRSSGDYAVDVGGKKLSLARGIPEMLSGECEGWMGYPGPAPGSRQLL